jgi:predicted  nucleic acid-binding Zn-ribbon protein
MGAWCGHCGESFRLGELVEDGFTGRCPRCGHDLAPGYAPVASAAVHDAMRAAEALENALGRLTDVAPRLHVDGRKLTADLAAALES